MQGKWFAAKWHGCPAGVCAQNLQAVKAILRAERPTCTVQVNAVASCVRLAHLCTGFNRRSWDTGWWQQTKLGHQG